MNSHLPHSADSSALSFLLSFAFYHRARKKTEKNPKLLLRLSTGGFVRPPKTNNCQQGEKGRPTAATRVFECLRLRDFPDSSKEVFSLLSLFFIQTKNREILPAEAPSQLEGRRQGRKKSSLSNELLKCGLIKSRKSSENVSNSQQH